MKHQDLLGDNAQIHNKIYQMMRDRILKLLETALIYGDSSGCYFTDVLGLTKIVEVNGRTLIVEIIYQDDEQVTMTAHEPEGDTVWTYIWTGGLVNITMAEDAIRILDILEKQDTLREGYLDKRDAWVQILERFFHSLGGVRTKRIKASDYVAMRKERSAS